MDRKCTTTWYVSSVQQHPRRGKRGAILRRGALMGKGMQDIGEGSKELLTVSSTVVDRWCTGSGEGEGRKIEND
jgi:hypothetical protein